MNRTMKDEDLKKDVALYAARGGHVHVNSVSEWIDKDDDYVRVSEIINVEFKPLPDDVILEGRVKSIDAEILKTRAEMTRRIEDLKDQKQRLIAITHEEGSPDD